MKSRTKKVKGSCACGAVAFTAKILLDDRFYFCHCADCRKVSGLYGAFAPVDRQSLAVKGSKKLKMFKSGPHTLRSFCGECGSALFWDRPEWIKKRTPKTYVLCGAIDGKFRVKNGLHIFTKEKGSYYAISDKLPKYKTLPR